MNRTSLATAAIALVIAVCVVGCGGTTVPPPPSSPGPPLWSSTITSLAPTAVAVGGPEFNLAVFGQGFKEGDSVFWQLGGATATQQLTTFVSSAQLVAMIPAAEIAVPGTAKVSVRGVTKSNSFDFSVFPIQAGAEIERVSVASDGAEANDHSFGLSVSADGRYVAFSSSASNLVVDDTNNNWDIFLRDTCYGAPADCVPTTQRVSVASDGSQAHGAAPAISGDSRYVVFIADDALVPEDTNGISDIYLRDTCIGAAADCLPVTRRVSVASNGSQANGSSGIGRPAISSDGRYVAFLSAADNLVPDDTNNWTDIFLRDTCLGAPAGCAPQTIRATLGNDGSQIFHDSGHLGFFSLSGNGRFVAFTTSANLLTEGDTADSLDVFVRDTCLDAAPECRPSTSLISLVPGASTEPAINADGRFVVFVDLEPARSGGRPSFGAVTLRDTCTAMPTGCAPRDEVILSPLPSQYSVGSSFPAISADGRFVVFLDGPEGWDWGARDGAFVILHDACTGAPTGCVPATFVLVETLVSDTVFYVGPPAISGDGRTVGFVSGSYFLVPNDRNGFDDVFVVRLPRP